MSTAIFYDLENISKFTSPRNYDEFKKSLSKINESELVDEIVLKRAYISNTHPAYIKYNKFLNSIDIDICGVDPGTNSNKANLVDFKMNVDCVAYSMSHKLDTVVVATGDADFGFLVDELKDYGMRVVVASYGITTNKSIIMISDDWIDFSGEYSVCTIGELMRNRLKLEPPVDYKDALHKVINAMLSDKLIKRYMQLGRFDLEQLREYTESHYRAPYLENVGYFDFVRLLMGGLNISFSQKDGRVIITPSDTPLPEPPLSIYEVIAGVDNEFSGERFKAWHSWFEENIEAVGELIYYLNFMQRSGLLKTGEKPEIVAQRKCAAALVEHTAAAVSLLNVKPEEKELEKLKKRFYRNPPKRRAEAEKPEPEEKEIYVQGVTTNFGRVVAYADDEAVVKVEFTEQFVKYLPNDITIQATTELREYFKGDRQEFTVPIKMEGSEFQRQVWDALLRIPYGETRSYKQIAEAIGRPKSSRAVGSACNKNPLLFMVPCHRAVGASGSLTGYAGGVELKKALLRSEASPADFKRFGKQYSYNMKHPESKGEYRTTEEINALLEKERAAEEKRKAKEEKRRAEEAAKAAEEKRKAEEAAKAAEEKRKAEEAAKAAEEKRKAEEAAKAAEEKRKAEEAAKAAEEKRRAEETAKEKRRAEEAEAPVEEKPVVEAKPEEMQAEASENAEAKPTEEAKPKRRLRRRRKAAEAKPEETAEITADLKAEEAPAEVKPEEKPSEDAKPTEAAEKTAEASAEEAKPKRRPRRRRKAAEAKPEETAEITAEAKAVETTAEVKPEEAQMKEKTSEDVKPTEADAKPKRRIRRRRKASEPKPEDAAAAKE